jgi:hypothetical protein
MKIKNIGILIAASFCIIFAQDHVSKLTWGYIKSESDSVVLSNPFEENMPYFTTINIFRKNTKIFTFHDSSVEFDGSDIIFTEHLLKSAKNSQLIFRCSGRPGDDYFFVIQQTEKGYRKLGYTPTSSSEIFGDIDHDGFFEIGGFENLHEYGNTKEELIKNVKREYKIFKIKDSFPLDTILMNRMLPIVLNNIIKNINPIK